MDVELRTSDQCRLVDFARTMIERARHTSTVLTDAEQELAISFHEKLDSKAIIDVLASYRRFFDAVRTQLVGELDSVLLAVDRMETELTILRGEIDGLRNDRAHLLSRVSQAERRVEEAAEEFTRQISDQVARLTSEFSSYLDKISGTSSTVEACEQQQISLKPETAAEAASPVAHGGTFARNVERVFDQENPDRQSPRVEAVPRRSGLTRILFGWIRRRSIPPHVKAITLGDRARDAREWHAAAQHYRTALQLQPNNSPIWVQYGHALKESGKKAEAERAYQKAIELDPGVADSHLQLGHVLKIQGRLGAAAAAYLHALSLDSSLHDATNELLGLGWTQQRIHQALQIRS